MYFLDMYFLDMYVFLCGRRKAAGKPQQNNGKARENSGKLMKNSGKQRNNRRNAAIIYYKITLGRGFVHHTQRTSSGDRRRVGGWLVLGGVECGWGPRRVVGKGIHVCRLAVVRWLPLTFFQSAFRAFDLALV